MPITRCVCVSYVLCVLSVVVLVRAPCCGAADATKFLSPAPVPHDILWKSISHARDNPRRIECVRSARELPTSNFMMIALVLLSLTAAPLASPPPHSGRHDAGATVTSGLLRLRGGDDSSLFDVGFDVSPLHTNAGVRPGFHRNKIAVWYSCACLSRMDAYTHTVYGLHNLARTHIQGHLEHNGTAQKSELQVQV